MDQPLGVNLVQVLHHGVQQGETVRKLHHTIPPEPRFQGFSLHIVHDDVGGFVFQEGLPHPHNGGDQVHPGHLPGFFQEVVVSILTIAPGQIGTVPYQAALALPAGYGACGVIFLDGHLDFQGEVKADVGDAEAALAQHIPHQIFAMEDGVPGHGFLGLRDGVLIKAANRAGAIIVFFQIRHAVRTTFYKHNCVPSFRLPVPGRSAHMDAAAPQARYLGAVGVIHGALAVG